MKVAIFEVCRSPEIKKKTESLILSNFFIKQAIDYKLYSNDGIWQKKTVFDINLFKFYLKKLDFNIVHLAMHGTNDGLILQWSNAIIPLNQQCDRARNRVPPSAPNSGQIPSWSDCRQGFLPR